MPKITCALMALIMIFCLATGCSPAQEEKSVDSEEKQQEVELPEGTVSIMDMGAVGDGVTDDAEALQEAIDTVTANEEGGTVYLPAGTYLVKTWIFLKSNLTIQMDEDAVILNGINTSESSSIMFMCGPYTGNGDKSEWEGIENITIEGGTIDMNGEMNASQTAPKNLPSVGSSTGAIALGYTKNVTLREVTFRDSFNGHAIQICNSDTVLIEDCKFIGQSLPSSNSASDSSQKEFIQIEPSSTAGFPYATNETFEASQNITIRNCYFGASDKCGEPMVAIGTHSQKYVFKKCNNITIENNTFDNMAYGAVRFAGYEDIVISGNAFIKNAKRESTNFRNGTCVMINIFCVNNTTDEMALNKRITIDNNTFEIDDADTRAIRVKNVTVTGNTLNGGWRGLYIDRCYGDVVVKDNTATNLTAENCYIRYTGSNELLSFYSAGDGMVEVATDNGKYVFTAVDSAAASFTGFYSNATGSNLLSESKTLSYSTKSSEKVEAYAIFK